MAAPASGIPETDTPNGTETDARKRPERTERGARIIYIDIDRDGSFTYDPRSHRVRNVWSWLTRWLHRDETTVVWRCKYPFCIDFDEHSPLRRFIYSGTGPNSGE